MTEHHTPDICDYEGATYRTDFWEGQDREYEDRVERIALGRLLPSKGKRIIEVGAGFGRLADLYAGYEQVVLFDYSRSQLEFARQQYGDEGYVYVAGNIYEIPFAPAAFDTALMIRVLHHMEDAPAALTAVRSVTRSGGTFILEFANKQNLKAIARYALGRQQWNPFDTDPVEFVELHYDFHPRYIQQTLQEVGFDPDRTLTVSHFRINLLKRLIPVGILATLDSVAQLTGDWWQLAPSVFVRNEAVGEDLDNPEGGLFRCPACGSLQLEESGVRLTCTNCKTVYAIRNGVYDFKEPAV